MGHVKNRAAEEQDEAAAAWTRKAQHENYCCDMCGRLIEYADREAFFRSQHCSDCASYVSKDK